MKHPKCFKKILNAHCIENIFVVGIMLLTIRSVFGLSQFDHSCFSILTYGAYGCALIKILLTRYSWKEKLVSLFICLIGMVTWSYTKKMVFFSNALFIIGMKSISKRKVLKITAITMMITLLYIMLHALILRSNMIQSDNGLTLGFLNPNGLQSFIIASTILYISAEIKRISLINLLVIFGINILFSVMTCSRTGTFIIVLWGIWVFCIKYIKNKFVKADTLYLAIVVLTGILLYCYHQYHYFVKINNILSGRLHQASYYISKYGITLWGSYLEELESDYEYWHNLLDCGYARLFVNYGLICGLVYIYFHYKTLKIARIKKDLSIQSVLIGFALLMITENGGIGINFNMSLLVLSTVLFEPAVYNKKSILRNGYYLTYWFS